MKRSYFPRHFWTLPGVLGGMVLLFASAAAQAPSIEGTYKLISRRLPDGTVLKPPDIMGLYTYTKSHRNFNIVLKDATGKFYSDSVVSTYKLTATEYSETRLYSIVNDQIGGREIVYNLSPQTRSAPVTVEGGRIQLTFSERRDLFPGRPTEVFEGDKMTATFEGRFVDVWEKVQ
jgi:hypothetical protein